MAYAKRLNVSSFRTGDSISLELSDDDYNRLETAYGRHVPPPARERLTYLCNEYFHWKDAEERAETYADVERLLKPVLSAVEGFNRLAFGTLTPITDAGGELAGLLAAHLGQHTIPIGRGCVEIYNDESSDYLQIDTDGPPLRLRLTAGLLEHLAYQLASTMDGIGKEIAEIKADPGRPGFTPGEAFRGWLWTLRVWAQENGFTAGPYSWDAYTAKRLPTKFAKFLFELNGLFPEGYKEPVSSPMAMADRLKATMKSR